jgi:phosphoglycerate dehydrogenase-like enzyme
MTKLLIVVHHEFDLWNVPAWFPEKLQADFPAIEVVHRSSYEGVEKELGDCEILFAFALHPEQFRSAQKLHWIHTPTAAVHQLLFPELVNSNVILSNAREVHGPVVAELVIALMFALAKKIPQAVGLQQKHSWGKSAIWNDGPRPREIAGATLGLIGVGGIGRTVARIASALGMRVIAVRERPEKEKPQGVEAVYAPAQIDELLSQSDFVVVAAPLTEASRGLINADRLAAMRPDAYLINVGRGPHVDEAALADALRNRRIAGAALDVFDQEPLPADSPLWDLENLLVTPHTGSLTEKLWQRHYHVFSENLRRYLAREPLLFAVDKHKGY